MHVYVLNTDFSPHRLLVYSASTQGKRECLSDVTLPDAITCLVYNLRKVFVGTACGEVLIFQKNKPGIYFTYDICICSCLYFIMCANTLMYSIFPCAIGVYTDMYLVYLHVCTVCIVCTYVHTYVHLYVRTYVCIYVMYMCILCNVYYVHVMYMCMKTYVHMCICFHAHVHNIIRSTQYPVLYLGVTSDDLSLLLCKLKPSLRTANTWNWDNPAKLQLKEGAVRCGCMVKPFLWLGNINYICVVSTVSQTIQVYLMHTRACM